MIQHLVPSSVAVVATNTILADAPLLEEERRLVDHAVERRLNEFMTGRACARRALARIGIAPTTPIAAGTRGQPLWPDGVIGSITHCPGYCASAVARARDVVALGIDAEVNAPLPRGVLEHVASEREREDLADHCTGVHTDRLLFSAKEAVYKAWFPLTGRSLGFDDVELRLDMDNAIFHARLRIPALATGSELRGRWRADGDVLTTAVVVA
jgi:4'-phosphopantetheinyl transferase EntD